MLITVLEILAFYVVWMKYSPFTLYVSLMYFNYDVITHIHRRKKVHPC
jgi:hypothetical protein